ncbi:MAG: ABC transporter permease [Defluviitaleaceae bacterium]|nr:ABC transporter permease [Defluviitaleaceae bacterium]
MLIKTIKYDFLFSRKAFFTTAALMIGFTALVWVVSFFEASITSLTAVGLVTMVVGIYVMCSAGNQVLQFFSQNFFGDAGYLMLTLPVSRGKLILSKIIVSMVWFNFLLLTGVIALFIFGIAMNASAGFSDFTIVFGTSGFITFIAINVFVFTLISVLFLAVTLSNSYIGSWRIPGIVAGLAVVGYGAAVIRLGTLLHGRHREMIFVEDISHFYDDAGNVIGTSHFHSNEWLVERGIRIGRIPIGETAYFDIFLWGMVLAMGLLALGVVYVLLKNKVSLD